MTQHRFENDSGPGLRLYLALLPVLLCPVLPACDRSDDWAVEYDRAFLLASRDDHTAALAAAKRALKLAEDCFAPEDLRLALSLIQVARLSLDGPDPRPATSLLERASAVLRGRHGREARLAGASVEALTGKALLAQGRVEEAGRHLRNAIETMEHDLSPLNDEYISTCALLARALDRLGRLQEAGRLFSKAVDLSMQSFGRDSVETALSLQALAEHYQRCGDTPSADIVYSRVIRVLGKAVRRGRNDLVVSYLRITDRLIASAIERGDRERASELLDDRIDVLGPTSLLACPSIEMLGRLYAETGRTDRAEAMYLWSLANLEHNLGRGSARSKQVLKLLMALYRKSGDGEKVREMEKRLRSAGQTKTRVPASVRPVRPVRPDSVTKDEP